MMVMSKKRGSQVGLKKNREATRIKNTEAMWEIVLHLRNERPDTFWTYKEVWSAAGLKSNVAFDSPWNSHIREAVDNHNKIIRQVASGSPAGQSYRRTLRDANRELKLECEAMRKERDQALAQIAVYEANAQFYEKKYNEMVRINERLRSNRGPINLV